MKGGREGGGTEGEGVYLTLRACAFLYLKFEALWPLDNSYVKDLIKMNCEVCIEWMGRDGEGGMEGSSNSSTCIFMLVKWYI